jgi:spore germination protein YaaH
MNRPIRWVQWLLLTLVGTLLLVVGLWLNWEVPILSPVNEQSIFRFLQNQEPATSSGKIVYGFVPYWTMNTTTIQPELTHLGYFALDIMPSGDIRTRTSDGGTEPGFLRLGTDDWFSMLNLHGKQTDLVFTQFNNDDITAFVTNPDAHQRFIESLDNLLLAYPITGVNIDIEYSGKVTDTVRDGLTNFMQTLNTHLKSRYQNIDLSIDVYAGAGTGRTIWDIPALEPHTDYFVVMAYDFHRRQSPLAGPVAPLFGGKDYWDTDISVQLQAFLENVPNEKILLGVPFYGYEWQTTSRDSQAHTFPDTGSTATFNRVQSLLAEKELYKVEEHWNEAALSPYISYEKDGNLYVVYYENSRSLSYKLDYVNQLDLAGIAIWALGYEGDSRELWEIIQRKIAK